MKKLLKNPLTEIELASIPPGSTVALVGPLVDSDDINWAFAQWTAEIISPSSTAVFTANGQPVPSFSGVLDELGEFNGAIIGNPFMMQPPGCTYTFTIQSVTSAPPSVITSVAFDNSVFAGAYFSSRVTPPRIQAAPLTYAYSASEILNPVNGTGYVNTTSNSQYFFSSGGYTPLSAGPLPEQDYPPAGLAVSSGSSWEASIPIDDVGNVTFPQGVFFETLKTLANGTDFNTITSPNGFYFCNGPLNEPPAGDERTWLLQVLNPNGYVPLTDTVVFQRAWNINDVTVPIYQRLCYYGTWQPWTAIGASPATVNGAITPLAVWDVSNVIIPNSIIVHGAVQLTAGHGHVTLPFPMSLFYTSVAGAAPLAVQNTSSTGFDVVDPTGTLNNFVNWTIVGTPQ